MPNQRLRERCSNEGCDADDGPLFRLRHLLLLLVVAAGLWGAFPRVEAFWKLHDRSTQLANYALCMAGPMGPTTLRDQPDQFRRLVRQRLLVSRPLGQPFSDCSNLAAAVAGARIGALHDLTANQFRQYAGAATPIAELDSLLVGVESLGDLANAAWPLHRGDHLKLLKPSSHAKEASHPVSFEPPAIGSGLPGKRTAYRSVWRDDDRLLMAVGDASELGVFASNDGGVTWQPTGLAQSGLGRYGGRCMVTGQPRAFVFKQEPHGLEVISLSGDDAVFRAQVLGLKSLARASCDSRSALLVGQYAQAGSPQRLAMFVCRHMGRCGAVAVEPSWLSGRFDVARVRGVIALASEHEGVVRVRTSRNEGVNWTPPVVAYDSQSFPELAAQGSVPNRMMVAGGRLYLHGANAGVSHYPVLVSDDLGASFRTPASSVLGSSRSVPGQPSEGAAPPVVRGTSGQHRIQ